MSPAPEIVPCLWFDDQAEAAAEFYVRTFPDSRIAASSRYPESADNPAHKPRGSVLTVEFEIANRRFTALNGGPIFVINPCISFFVHAETAEETKGLFAALLDGGEALMPLDSYPWSDCYGWVKDRFGVSWQVIAGRRPPGAAKITPCLMFTGDVHGRAEEAMRAYAGIFPESAVLGAERYLPGEGPIETTKHGRFRLADQDMIAMDSHIEHGFTFNEALSLQVMCADQDEVDRYWNALSAGGKPSVCGWLQDRFGLSWQIVPSGISEWLSCRDAKARDRAFQAMMGMTKPDVATLRQAFEGK